jgi:hypothetical protein
MDNTSGSNHNDTSNDLDKSKRALILVSIILFIISIGFAYLYIQEKNNPQMVSDNFTAQNVDSNQPGDMQSNATTYSSTVGKFQITLPEPYAIILRVDGPFEGGPVTQLQIGNILSAQNNTVEMPSLGEITLTAVPSSNYGGDFESFLASTFNEQVANPVDSNIKFDGVGAEAYKLDGLVDTDLYVFENNGLYYQLSVDNPERENYSKIVKDISDGFIFIE